MFRQLRILSQFIYLLLSVQILPKQAKAAYEAKRNGAMEAFRNAKRVGKSNCENKARSRPAAFVFSSQTQSPGATPSGAEGALAGAGHAEPGGGAHAVAAAPARSPSGCLPPRSAPSVLFIELQLRFRFFRRSHGGAMARRENRHVPTCQPGPARPPSPAQPTKKRKKRA